MRDGMGIMLKHKTQCSRCLITGKKVIQHLRRCKNKTMWVLTMLGHSRSKNEWKDSEAELEDVEGCAIMLPAQRKDSWTKSYEVLGFGVNGTTDIVLLWHTDEWSVQSLLSHSASIPESMEVILNIQLRTGFNNNTLEGKRWWVLHLTQKLILIINLSSLKKFFIRQWRGVLSKSNM